MPTERFRKRQAEINTLKENARATYPLLWRILILEWQSAKLDAAWLTYAANYLFLQLGCAGRSIPSPSSPALAARLNPTLPPI